MVLIRLTFYVTFQSTNYGRNSPMNRVMNLVNIFQYKKFIYSLYRNIYDLKIKIYCGSTQINCHINLNFNY